MEQTAPHSQHQRLLASLHHLEHILPAQAPLRDFVHHNTLHGFQHLPFPQALAEAGRLLGANPWFDEARCRELWAQQRVTRADLRAALAALPECAADRPLLTLTGGDGIEVKRGDVLLAALLYPTPPLSLSALRWQQEEGDAFRRFPTDLDPEARAQLLGDAAPRDRSVEAPLLADLWLAARQVLGLAAESGQGGAAGDSVFFGDFASVASPEPSWEKCAAALWKSLAARLGGEWTWSDWLNWLSGEDVRQAYEPMLIRQLAAHLDQGLAAWRNPARQEGFYAAWRRNAAFDWGWPLAGLPDAQRLLDELPEDPFLALIGELERLGPDETHWCAYLERMALELPGWAGMLLWREQHPQAGAQAGPQAGDAAPVAMLDYLAVRLVLERLHVEQRVRERWNQPLLLSELGEFFLCRPAELWLRDQCARGALPEMLQDEVERCRRLPLAETVGQWELLAARLANWQLREEEIARQEGLAAWPLFRLSLRLGLDGQKLRAAGSAGAASLLQCVDELDANRRGYLWLLAYEHHYRQQIFSALRANHGRGTPPGDAVAQMIFCMDDREEGTRRHLEEINPAVVTFGAAGFFGLPMRWQGLGDAAPSALCPVVVRPGNAVSETVAPQDAAQQALRSRRRRFLQRWRERLYQGSRRDLFLGTVLPLVAAPGALLALLGRSLAPDRMGAALQNLAERLFAPLPGVPTVNASPEESGRMADPDAPRQGFSLNEQVERVGGFLRNIGLTANFAPLVVLVGHGSDSRNNPHLAAYDCGACSGRHGGPNARVFAVLANRPEVRAALAALPGRGIVIPETTWFVGAEHNTCDESMLWYDLETLPEGHANAFAALRRDVDEALRLHAVERCRRLASAPAAPSPAEAQRHVAARRQDIGQSRPELGHATIAAAFIGRRSMSRGAFFDRRVFLISYDPTQDSDGRILEATLLAAGPVGAGISLEYYFSTVDNERFGCGTKVMHNLAGLFGVMDGSSSDLRTGLPRQMIEIHEPMRLLVVVEQRCELLDAIVARQPALQELIGNGWIVLAARHPEQGDLALHVPGMGWQPWQYWKSDAAPAGEVPQVTRSADWFAGQREPLPPVLLAVPQETV